MIFLATAGSRLYGTALPESDLDVKGVHVPTAHEILFGINYNRPLTVDGAKDAESMSLLTFCRQVVAGQTGATEMLFIPPDCRRHVSQTWMDLLWISPKLLSKRCAGFVGYCRTQASKYGLKGTRYRAVKALREWLDCRILEAGSPPTHDLRLDDIRSELIDECRAIMVSLGQRNLLGVVPAPTSGGRVGWYLQACDRLYLLTCQARNVVKALGDLEERYGHRAVAASTGQDWKALGHALRVAYEAEELLNTRHITFPRPEAAKLLEVRQGRVPYEEVSAEIEEMLVRVEAAQEKSQLPETVDDSIWQEFVEQTYREAIVGT